MSVRKATSLQQEVQYIETVSPVKSNSGLNIGKN